LYREASIARFTRSVSSKSTQMVSDTRASFVLHVLHKHLSCFLYAAISDKKNIRNLACARKGEKAGSLETAEEEAMNDANDNQLEAQPPRSRPTFSGKGR
jgi:hypothetical protein